MDVEKVEEFRPQESDGAGEMDVEPFLRVDGLEGGFQFFFIAHECQVSDVRWPRQPALCKVRNWASR